MASKSRIINGPSKDDIALNLFSRDKLKEEYIKFTLEDRYDGTIPPGNGEIPHIVIGVAVSSVEREDNSDDSFNITGRVVYRFGNVYFDKVKIYYNTKHRNGKIEVAR
jgi:hypothetical protein